MAAELQQNRVRSIDQVDDGKSRPGGKGIDKLGKSARDRSAGSDQCQLVAGLGLKPKGDQLQGAAKSGVPADVQGVVLAGVGAGHLQLQGASGVLGVIALDVDRLRVGISGSRH